MSEHLQLEDGGSRKGVLVICAMLAISKRSLLTVLAMALAALVLSLAACGGSGGSKSASEPSGGAGLASYPTNACSDPWVTQAVGETTGVTPVGNVCNIYLYNGGSWSDYAHLKNYVGSVMRTCGDRWVTQAFIQVVGRVPTQTECNIKNYGNGSWSSYPDLVSKVDQVRNPSRPTQPHRTVDNVSFVPYSSGTPQKYSIKQVGNNLGRNPFGEVSDKPFIYGLYWGTAWNGRQDLVNYMNKSLQEMSQGSYANKLSQYGVGKGVDVGYWVDATPYDSAVGTSWAVVVGRQLGLVASEVSRIHDNSQSAIPRQWYKSGNPLCGGGSPTSPVIAIFTVAPRNDQSGWAGYHDWVGERSSPCFSVAGPYGQPQPIYPPTHGYLPYFFVKVPEAVFTSSDRNEVKSNLDVATAIASHEYVETVTNPKPWFTYNDWSHGVQGEPADKCDDEPLLSVPARNTTYFLGKGPIAGQYIQGSSFAFNSYWSNNESGCIHSP